MLSFGPFDSDKNSISSSPKKYSSPQFYKVENKGLANAKGPCDCSVLCLRKKSSLCRCRHRILDMTSFGFGNADHSLTLTACTALATTG